MKAGLKILVALLFTGTFNILYAQIGLGIRGGVNFASAELEEKNNGTWETSYRDVIPGLNATLLAEIGITKKIAIQPEIAFNRKGYRTTLLDDTEYRVKFNYIEVPVLLKGKFGSGVVKFTMVLGPTFGYAINGKVKSGNTEVDIDFDKDEINQFEIGALFGIGVDFKLGPGNVFLDSRLSRSINNLDTSDASDEFHWHNQYVSFGMGYIIGLGNYSQ